MSSKFVTSFKVGWDAIIGNAATSMYAGTAEAPTMVSLDARQINKNDGTTLAMAT